MDEIKAIWDFVTSELAPHWIGIMYTIVVAIIAQTLKTRVLTVDIAVKSRVVFWLRRTFPLLLLLVSMCIGLFSPGEFAPGIATAGKKALYLMGCAGVAIIGFNIFKQWVKKKYDVDIAISGSIAPEKK